jgi:LmbE family N-acetylglucosaminyl deacetylase
LVYNLFCAHYRGPLSPAARELHASWEDPEDITALRVAEDRQALGVIGAGAIYGDMRDLIYRQDARGKWLYTDMGDIMGRRNPEDDALVEQSFEKVTAMFSTDEVDIYAPMSIGEHIDHGLAFDTGMRLQAGGYRVNFYEDLPYALHVDWLEKRLNSISGKEAQVMLFSLKNLERKLTALHAYASQIAALFGDEVQMRESLTAQALQASGRMDMGGEKVWRIWKPSPQSSP